MTDTQEEILRTKQALEVTAQQRWALLDYIDSNGDCLLFYPASRHS